MYLILCFTLSLLPRVNFLATKLLSGNKWVNQNLKTWRALDSDAILDRRTKNHVTTFLSEDPTIPYRML